MDWVKWKNLCGMTDLKVPKDILDVDYRLYQKLQLYL